MDFDAVDTGSRPAHEPSPNHAPRWGKAPATKDVRDFLAGPRARGTELARAIRIFMEFVRGFRALHFVGPCVTVFGSARFKEDHPYYAMGRDIGKRIAELGLTAMTGGGPGIMEAVNRGAKEAGGRSIGCNIVLPMEQKPNPYVDRFIEFRYFFVRKVMLVKYSYAFVALPGGFGTLDELFEIATLVQTNKVLNFPIVLMGVEFWTPMMNFIQNDLVAAGTISPPDVRLITLTDDPEVAVAKIQEGLALQTAAHKPRPKPKRILGER